MAERRKEDFELRDECWRFLYWRGAARARKVEGRWEYQYIPGPALDKALAEWEKREASMAWLMGID